MEGGVVERSVVKECNGCIVGLEDISKNSVQDLIGLHWSFEENLQDTREQYFFNSSFIGVELFLVFDVLFNNIGGFINKLSKIA